MRYVKVASLILIWKVWMVILVKRLYGTCVKKLPTERQENVLRVQARGMVHYVS